MYENIKKCYPKIRLFLICFVLVIIVYFSMLFSDISKYDHFDTSNDLKVYPLVPKASNFSSVDHSAYVYLALGAQANQLNCEASIESLVKYGGWNGHVYMITDRKNCYDKDKIVANAGMDASKLHIIVTNEHFDGGFDLQHSEMGARISRFRSFTMKTRLFDFITDPNIQVLAYVDCDIIFGIEGCAKEFITTGPSWYENQIRFTRVSKYSEILEGVHCGSLVVHREHSKDLLHLWRNELEKLTSEGDNDAFSLLYHNIALKIKDLKNNNQSIRMFNNNHSRSIPKDEQYINQLLYDRSLNHLYKNENPLEPIQINDKHNERFEVFLDQKRISNLVCMSHISKAACNRMGRNTIQEFVNKFNLKTYDNKYNYCTSPILQPLLYGWFPFSYLPFCPKLEQIL